MALAGALPLTIAGLFHMVKADDAQANEPLLDTLDLCVVIVVVCALLYVAVKRVLAPEKQRGDGYGSSSRLSSVNSSLMSPSGGGPSVFADDSVFTEKMKRSDKKLVVFFGSQTGTAEEYASRLVAEARNYGIKALVADVEDYDMKTLTQLQEEIPDAIALFCMATYGEGDPTDNAAEFYEMLKEEMEDNNDFALNGLRFGVFALGNKQYEHFNAVGKFVDNALSKFGGKQLVKVGLGDDDDNMEEDFAVWREELWATVCKEFDIDPEACALEAQRQYKLKTLEGTPKKIFNGEPFLPNTFTTQKRPFTVRNPLLAKIAVKKELYRGARSCLHIELDIEGTGMRYSAGDHVGIYAQNDKELVERLGVRLGLDLDTVMTMNATDPDTKKRHPFPCPCTYRTALMYYVNITSVPKMHVIRELAKYTTDDKAKKHFEYITSKEGHKEYGNWALRDHRTLMQILDEYQSLSPPIDVLLEMLPRLQPRYYSISSSTKAHPTRVHVTAAVVRYETPLNQKIEGVCTGWFDKLNEGDRVPIFIRMSTFRLPIKASTPVVMIGPGTGVAPFRGFIQDRVATKKKGKLVGDLVLFFGCQKRAENFMYEEEMLGYQKSGDLTQLYLAFSRDTAQKVYVQHRLEEFGEYIFGLIKNKSGHVYLCGDAKNMAHDVHKTFVKVAQKHGNMSEQQAESWVADLRRRKRYCEDVWS